MSENIKKNFKYNEPCGCGCGLIVHTNNGKKKYFNNMHRARAARNRKAMKKQKAYETAHDQWESLVKKLDFDVYEFLKVEILNCYYRYKCKKTVSFDIGWRMLAQEIKPEIDQPRKDHPSLINGMRIHARIGTEKKYPHLMQIINHRSLDEYDNER